MPDARRATYRRSSILMTMCTARRPPIDKPVSQRLTFPRSSRSFARQLIYRRALELYAAARRRAAFTDDIVPLLSPRRGFDTGRANCFRF